MFITEPVWVPKQDPTKKRDVLTKSRQWWKATQVHKHINSRVKFVYQKQRKKKNRNNDSSYILKQK